MEGPHGSLSLGAAKPHFTVDDAVENVGRTVVDVNLLAGTKAPFLRDPGDPQNLVRPAEREEVAALEEDDRLNPCQLGQNDTSIAITPRGRERPAARHAP
jgi:hypothetical protein